MRMAQTLWDYSVALVGGEETIYSPKRKLIESGANAALWALSGAPDFRLTYDTTCNTTALAFSRIVSPCLARPPNVSFTQVPPFWRLCLRIPRMMPP